MAFIIERMLVDKPKPFPVFLLLDCSGSMNIDGRMESLNAAVEEMLVTLRREEKEANRNFLLSIITFQGEEAELVQPPAPLKDVRFTPLKADRTTPLGAALDLASTIIEDKTRIPSRACRPAVILVCDGVPTDDWEPALERFTSEGRTAKCDRMALAVGEDLPERALDVLNRFVAGTGHPVMKACDAKEIISFFKFATMSVVLRGRSQNVAQIPSAQQVTQAVKSLEEIEEEEFQRLVREVAPLGFTQSAEVSNYIVQNQLGHRYPHIAGIGEMVRGGDCWEFNGAISKRHYARLCAVLQLSDRRSGAVLADFTPYADRR